MTEYERRSLQLLSTIMSGQSLMLTAMKTNEHFRELIEQHAKEVLEVMREVRRSIPPTEKG